MSEFVDAIRNHGIWAELEAVGPLIDKAAGNLDLDLEQIDNLERVRAILSISGARLAATDPYLLSINFLNELLAQFSNVRGSLERFVESSESDALNFAIQYSIGILPGIASIPSAITSQDQCAISELSASYRKTMKTHLADQMDKHNSWMKKAEEHDKKIGEIDSELSSEQQKVGAFLIEQQSIFSTTQDRRASEAAKAIDDLAAKSTVVINEQQTLFSNDQNARNTAFSEALNQYSTRLLQRDADFAKEEIDRKQEHQELLSTLQQSYENDASDVLVQIRQHKLDVEQLVGVIGNLGITSGYKTIADHARRMLYIWQGITLTSLLGLIMVASLVAFPKLGDAIGSKIGIAISINSPLAQSVSTPTPDSVGTQKSDSDFYHGLLSRVFLSITFGVFAAYAGQQASRFFQTEQSNRKLALELEALGPFIEPLSKEDKDKFRIQIGDRSFGGQAVESRKPNEDEIVSFLKILRSKELQDILGELKNWIAQKKGTS